MARRGRRRRRSLWRRLLGVLAGAVLVALLASVGSVLALRWMDPLTTSFIVQRKVAVHLAGGRAADVAYRWVPWQEISPEVGVAVVAAEDQLFPEHLGFDVESIKEALAERERGGRVRGASTISQQVAKNLFLWPGRSWLRKGLEAWFTVLIETAWPKRRILEVYVNVAQFGDDTFGVGAAAERFFAKPASQITAAEAALLAAVLPNPKRLHVERPSRYVRQRQRWIRSQMRMLGGPGYLHGI